MDTEPVAASASPERILVRGSNWLGDAVMSLPALQRLREARPEAQIAVLTPAKLAGLWPHVPAVDTAIEVAKGEGVFAVARRLRPEGFGAALVLPNSHRSALEARFARIPLRIGYARPWRNWLLTLVLRQRREAVPLRKRSASEVKRRLASAKAKRASPAPPPTAHQMFDYLQLVTALGASSEPVAPHLQVTDQDIEAVQARYGLFVTPQQKQPWFGLNPGAEYGPAKRWPADRFVTAAVELHQRTGCRWLILGGPKDAANAGIADQIQRATRKGLAVNLTGQTSLSDLCALLKLCRVLLTNDTGPMHVAAAVGTPVVALFGSTSPELTGPGLPGDPRHQVLRAAVPCSPCFLRQCPVDFRCMTSLSVDQVVHAVLRALAAQG